MFTKGQRTADAREVIAAAVVETLERRRLLSMTYYLSPAGSDANPGTSSAAPWRSIAKVNALDLDPGDAVLFQGGANFADPDVPASIVNPGFESGTTGWDENFGNATAQPGVGHNSLRGLRVGPGEGGMGQVVTTRVQPLKTYTFSAWGRTTDPFQNGFVGITFKDEFGNPVGGVQLAVSGLFYRRYARSFVAPASFAFADVWAYKHAGDTPFFIDVDDFGLVENKNSLFFDAADSGTAAAPVTVGSYGAGRATIASHDGIGLYGYNTSGFRVANLNFAGSGAANNRASGITFFTDLPGNVKLDHLRIEDVNVSGFGDAGISVGGWNDPAGTTGYRDVRITRANAASNGHAGIHVWGPALYSHEDVTVSDSRVQGTAGSDVSGNSGDGILIGSTDGALVERNVVHNNGAAGHGAVGVRAYNSTDVVVQFNESYDNRTSGTIDGGGFALDWGTTNSVMQYNYSHGNDGSGFLLGARVNTAPTGGNTVRYNVSENDGRKNGYAGLHVWNEGQTIAASHVYNNTVYMSPAAGGSPKAVWMQSPDFSTASTDVKVRNNILFTTGGARLVEIAPGQSGILFQGNDYWPGGANFEIVHDGTVYNGLAAWRAATAQERDGAQDVGMSVNPMLAAPGQGGTIGNPASLASTLTAYRTQTGSPVRDAALDLLARFGVNPGSRDFYAATLPQGAGFDVGAHEAPAQDVVAPTVSSAAFNYLTRHDIVIRFSEDVSASVGASDLVVENLTTGQTIAPGAFTLSVNGSAGAPTTATWVANQPLPDGNYRATLPAGSVLDAAGNPLAADFVLTFFFLQGDANHDGRVNLSDFNVLAANFGQSGRDFSQGDFDYDGNTNLADFNILAGRFGQQLPPSASPGAFDDRSGDRASPLDDLLA